MTVIMLEVGFFMTRIRCARWCRGVTGLSVALVSAFLRPRSGHSINFARQFGAASFAGLTTDLLWSLRFCEWP